VLVRGLNALAATICTPQAGDVAYRANVIQARRRRSAWRRIGDSNY